MGLRERTDAEFLGDLATMLEMEVFISGEDLRYIGDRLRSIKGTALAAPDNVTNYLCSEAVPRRID